MAKRIEFIAPVEAMRGNLSGKQELLYAQNDNPAFEAPDGKQFARNYQPRFIGAKRSSTGLKYFAVRTKNAVNNSLRSRSTQAYLGAASAISAAVIGTPSIWATYQIILTNEYNYRKSHGTTKAKTIRAFLTELFVDELKDMNIYLITYLQSNPGTIVSIGNPYNLTQFDEDRDPSIADETLVKFWTLLAENAITFKVGQFKGVAHNGDLWQAYVQEDYNTINAEVSGNYVKIGDMWIQSKDSADPEDAWAYVQKTHAISGEDDTDIIYRLTSQAPA